MSLVDSPANKHAKVMLFKRAASEAQADGDYPSSILKRSFTADERKARAKNGHALPDGSYPIDDVADLKNAIRAIGRAKDPAKVKAHIRSRAKALGASDLLPDTWNKRDSGAAVIKLFTGMDPKFVAKGYGDGDAVDFDQAQAAWENSEVVCGLMDEVNEAVCSLSSALWSIQQDETIENKGEAVQECLDQFGEHVKTIVPEGVENAYVAASLMDAGYTIDAQGGIQLEKGADSMLTNEQIAKRLGLDASASEAAILAFIDKAKKKTPEEEAEEAKKSAAFAGAVKKMSAKHRAYMAHPDAKMPKGGKEAFADMEPGERDEHMAKNPIEDDEDEEGGESVEKAIKKGDAFRTPDGIVVTRKSAGAVFDVMKSQNARLVAAEKANSEAKDKADEKERKDKAEKSLTKIGKADELGSLLFQIAKHDPALADKVEGVLKHANDLVEKSAVFTEFGKGSAAIGSAAEAIQKGADALLKAEPQLKTIEKARTEFRKRNPDMAKREQTESAQPRR